MNNYELRFFFVHSDTKSLSVVRVRILLNRVVVIFCAIIITVISFNSLASGNCCISAEEVWKRV